MTPARPLGTVILGLTTLLLAATFASPALAAPVTTSWSGEQPAANSSIASDPRAASVSASSSAALSGASAHMKIDGVEYACFVTNPPSTSGHWQTSEVWDDDAEEWTTSQIWVVDPDLTKAKLLTYAWGGPLGTDGEHTAVASIKNANGDVVSDSWTFWVRIPPKIGSPTPTNGSTVGTTSPVISVPVSDNGAVTSWDVTVNGAVASAGLSGGVLHITPSSPLPEDAASTIAVTVRDAVGATASLTWSFTVQTHAPMPSMLTACLECHPGYDTDPDMTPDCAQCHSGVLNTPHQGDPATLHMQADASCAPCHLRSVPNEHARRTDATGAALTCMTCHKSADPKVVSAIASRTSKCASCHDNAAAAHDAVGSPTKHTPPANVTCLVSGCHATTNVAQLHADAPGGCSVCHGPGRTPSTDCRSCHPTGSGAPTATSLAGTAKYHHDNVKYLNDSTDATTSPYYWIGAGDPTHGWNLTLFTADCRTCHHIH